ncbi:MAG: hypothetical protein IJ055_01210 [Oscillospiraceae bacterium]|nr:hypothetical protein [Oscillospiraceae bacterium]
MMKKQAIIAVSTACLLLAGTAGTVYAYSRSDVGALLRSITRQEAVSAGQDVDGNGRVDVMDLTTLKQLLQSSTQPETVSVPASANYVKLQSRTLEKDGVTWLVQSGSAAEFTVTGTECAVTLTGSSGIQNEEKYRPRYGIFVDDELVEDVVMEAQEQTVTLFSESKARTADVRIMLLSEAMYGGVGIRDITVTSGAAVPVRPAEQKALRIGFIGDSITCAYGVQGKLGDAFTTGTEDFSRSYAYLTARFLDADYTTCCYSGHGIYSGYTSDGKRNADALIPDCYDLVSKYKDYGQQQDFEGDRPCDAIVINLGTNDINFVAADPEVNGALFVEAYKSFLTHLRALHPGAAIVCTVGTMGGDDVYTLITQACDEYTSETGDANVTCYFSRTHTQDDGFGADYHPSALTQERSSYVLADKILTALGKESSKIGLDVAADGVYDVTTSNGATAAQYYGYGQFWVNMVSGGTAPSDVEATVSGLPLRAGGTYRLSFDYTTGQDITLPVLVRGSAVYYETALDSTSERQHFETEFTCDADDEAAQIVFQVGGHDSMNSTFYNVTLTRLS